MLPMPFAGTFNPAIRGERKSFSIDFANDLPAGDAIASVSTALEVFHGVDPNVELLFAPGPPAISGSVVTQVLGFGPGFQPGPDLPLDGDGGHHRRIDADFVRPHPGQRGGVRA